jgi:hypothetical protein
MHLIGYLYEGHVTSINVRYYESKTSKLRFLSWRSWTIDCLTGV